MEAAPSAARSSGSLPSACTQSTCSSACGERSATSFPSAGTGKSSPVTLFTSIWIASTVSGRSRAPKSRPPSASASHTSTSKPSSRSDSAVAMQDGCSNGPTSTWLPWARCCSAWLRMAMLFASVAPEVNTTPPGSAPATAAATSARASPIAAAARMPLRWRDDGLP